MAMSGLDDQLLEAFIDGFYGYGNLEAPYWFIGMEEGGGETLEEVQRRIAVWRDRGKSVTEDLVHYCNAIGATQFFQLQPKLQRTWSKLIRVLHILEGKPTFNNALRQTQRESFGRTNGTSYLLELLPLPSPSTHHWLYGGHEPLPYLKNRETYRNAVIPKRIEKIKAMMCEHKPRTVLFYGTSYQEHWQAISEQDFEAEAIGKFDVLFGGNKGTLFVVTLHPTFRGISNDYFNKVGELMRDKLCT